MSESSSATVGNAVPDAIPETPSGEIKIALVLDPTLGPGQVANRGAVLATGLAARHPEILGPDPVTENGQDLVGFTKVPIVVLKARRGEDLIELDRKARELSCTSVVFLARAQGLRSYDAYLESISRSDSLELDIDSCMILGPKKAVNKLTGNLPALR
jgi:hypothetical protein